MKKIFLLVIICSAFIADTKACDICGCGAGNNYVGILPEFRKRVMGLRYRYNSIKTHLGISGETYLTKTENYRTTELWGAWNIASKWRLMITVPYTFNERIGKDATVSDNGIGDISAGAYYQLLQHKSEDSKQHLLMQSLWIGGGVKLPTGQYKAANKDDANFFQSGTGSTDFFAQAMYDIRRQDAGLNLNALYKVNTTNKESYRYGDRFSASAQFYYKLKAGKSFTLAPNTGLAFETSAEDYNEDIKVFASGGNVLMGTVGLECNTKSILFGANFQSPFAQDMANGFAKAQNRMMIHAAIVF